MTTSSPLQLRQSILAAKAEIESVRQSLPAVEEDSNLALGSRAIGREYVYRRDRGVCEIRGSKDSWVQVVVQRPIERRQGGATLPENGVLAHRHCALEGATAAEFASQPGQS